MLQISPINCYNYRKDFTKKPKLIVKVEKTAEAEKSKERRK
jgi:hypothetical protein